MWDLRVANPFGRISIRNLLVFVAAVIATVFAYILLAAPTTHAADAIWKGDSIVYQQNQYTQLNDAKADDTRGLEKGTHIYQYVEPSTDSTPAKAHVLYFAPKDDPTEAKSAKYVTYDFTPPDTYKNPTDTKTVSLDTDSSDIAPASSCDLPGGLSWIICPVTSFMADALDWTYSALEQFLTVQPLHNDQKDSLFAAWSIMRNFANVAFVIAFLIIIYSQISSIGISNYGIKKMLPRLVIAAILVNISYWICAVAIDISNILGYSIEDLFMSIIKNMGGIANNSSELLGWKQVTTAVLSGGTLAGAGALAFFGGAAGGSITGAIYMLIPVILGVLVAALVAVLIMAARQALIVILVIIAPLAFVAYLLPNTEKYFNKWKDLLITMLVMFPMFGILFGASRLAGLAIMQNATSIIMLILGMAVQIAPLVILPFVLKFSGSVLGRIAGMADNKRRGIVDRSRNFAQAGANSRKQAMLARTRYRGALTRIAQKVDDRQHNREKQDKINEALADTRRHGGRKHHELDEAMRDAERGKQIVEQHHDADWYRKNRTNKDYIERERQLRLNTDQAALAKNQLEGAYEDYKAEGLNKEGISDLQRSAIVTSQNLAIAGMRQEAAKRKQASEISNALLHDSRLIDGEDLRKYAGGVEGTTGEESALSKAVAAHRKQFGENVANNLELMKHFNVSNPEKSQLSMGENVEKTDDNGAVFTFDASNKQTREAAIEEVLKSGSYKEIDRIIMSSGIDENGNPGVNHEYAGTIGRAIKQSGVTDKAPYYGSMIINEIAQGHIGGEAGRTKAIVFHLEEGKLKPEAIAGMDSTALEHMFKVASNPSAYAKFAKNQDPKSLINNSAALRTTVAEILDTELLKQNASQQAQQTMNAFLGRK